MGLRTTTLAAGRPQLSLTPKEWNERLHGLLARAAAAAMVSGQLRDMVNAVISFCGGTFSPAS
jgi:hypothetical protein